MDVTVGTSLVVLGVDQAMADRLNRPLGWTRESWAGFAAGRVYPPARRKGTPAASPTLAAPVAPIMTPVLPPRGPSRDAPGPSFHTVIELDNGADHGTYQTETPPT